MQKKRISLGLMSGTSGDGVDASLIKTNGLDEYKVLADKYQWFQERVRAKKLLNEQDQEKVIYLTPEYIKKTPEGIVLDNLRLNKMCCRRHILTHVDIE